MAKERNKKSKKCGWDGSERHRYTMEHRVIALNRMFLKTLLGHLSSMPIPQAFPFHQWSSLWFDAQAESTFTKSSAFNDFLFFP